MGTVTLTEALYSSGNRREASRSQGSTLRIIRVEPVLQRTFFGLLRSIFGLVSTCSARPHSARLVLCKIVPVFVKNFVKGRKQQQRQCSGCDDAADYHCRKRPLNLRSSSDIERHWHKSETCHQRCHQDRSQPLRRAIDDCVM